MSENSQGRLLLTEKDFVDVVNEEGDVVGRVPKHWDNDVDLAPGLTKKTKSGGRSSSSSSASSGADKKPDSEPAGNASTEVWAAYAREHKGAQDADLVDEQGEPLTRDALREKYGTPAES